MKILVYGFKPFGGQRTNISERVVRTIGARRDLSKIVFPIRYDKRMFLSAIRKSKPDAILGLGQCQTGSKLRNERIATNWFIAKKASKKTHITKNGLRRVALNRVPPNPHVRGSTDAGRGLCNYSMYVIGGYARSKKIPFAFIHIPKDFELKKIRRYINVLIDWLQDEKRKK